MTAQAGEWAHGVRQIVRLNWPYYAIAGAVIVITVPAVPRLPGGAVAHAIVYSATAAAAFWTIASLAVSWWVYDRSPLMTGEWIREALGYRPRAWLNIHAGLDEVTPILRTRLRGSRGRVFDIFDDRDMTEPSIARARIARQGSNCQRVDFRHLPVPTATIDTVFLLLSAHELRTHDSRCALFHEIHRVLTLDGCLLLAEHLRDVANVLAYGPGAWHFHSRRAWTRGFEQTGFGIYDEFSITPFVRVFVLRRLP
jgi:SAM-dependent methyltransferase